MFIFEKLLNCFIERLPDDSIPYWYMIFTDDSGEPRDTSSAAIVACGVLEMNKYMPNERHVSVAEKIIRSLYEHYTTQNMPKSNAILTDAMLSRLSGHKPEAAIYGDYYFTEAITRMLNKGWRMYW